MTLEFGDLIEFAAEFFDIKSDYVSNALVFVDLFKFIS